MITILEDARRAHGRLLEIAARTSGAQVSQEAERVREIVHAVKTRGDAALLEFTARFDGRHFNAEDLLVSRERCEKALETLEPDLRQALNLAHERIRAFHARQRPHNIDVRGPYGERLGRLWHPLERAGLYVPGGRAAYPSTVLMNVVPARVAGVGQVVVVTPPGRDGEVNPVVLAAAALTGVDAVYRVGGAQAVAALAYGTETIPAVDVICGPGNIYVTLAKKAVYGKVAIDALAGPSEVLVIADDTAEAGILAADLLAQAEHDPMAAAILLTTSDRLIRELPDCLAQQLASHPRQGPTRQALVNWGLVVKVQDLQEAAELANTFAPEHLELMVADPEALLPHIRHAGAIFLGADSPEAVGDYLAGPNHTLPTSGMARFSGALGVETFMTHTSLIGFNRQALAATGRQVMRLAAAEGLHSHGESIRRRLPRD